MSHSNPDQDSSPQTRYFLHTGHNRSTVGSHVFDTFGAAWEAACDGLGFAALGYELAICSMQQVPLSPDALPSQIHAGQKQTIPGHFKTQSILSIRSSCEAFARSSFKLESCSKCSPQGTWHVTLPRAPTEHLPLGPTFQLPQQLLE